MPRLLWLRTSPRRLQIGQDRASLELNQSLEPDQNRESDQNHELDQNRESPRRSPSYQASLAISQTLLIRFRSVNPSRYSLWRLRLRRRFSHHRPS